MATVPHVISGLGLRKFQADGFLFTRVYNKILLLNIKLYLKTRTECLNALILWFFPKACITV